MLDMNLYILGLYVRKTCLGNTLQLDTGYVIVEQSLRPIVVVVTTTPV